MTCGKACVLLLWALLLGFGLVALAAALLVSAAISQAAWAKTEEAQLARARAGSWQAAADLFRLAGCLPRPPQAL